MKTNKLYNGMTKLALFLSMTLLGGSSSIFAQFTFVGDYDKTFAAPNGYYVDPIDVDPVITGENTGLYTGEILADGSIIAGGALTYRTFGNSDGQDFYLKRFLPSGAVDLSFGGGTGFVRTDFFARFPNASPQSQNAAPSLDFADVLKIQSDGKILFAGSCDITSPDGFQFGNFGRDVCLIRYNADGSIDASFGNTLLRVGSNASNGTFAVGAGRAMFQTGIREDGNFGGTNGYIYDMAIQPDGKILLVGETRDIIGPFVQGAPTTRFTGIILRLNSNGSLDSTFGTNGIARFIGVNSATNPNDFGCWGPRRFYGIALQPDGRIIAVGHDSINNPGTCSHGLLFVVTRWTASGQIETVRRLENVTTFSAQNEKAVAARIATGNKLFVSGSYQGKATLVKFNISDLSLDTTFGTNGVAGYSSGNRTLSLRAVQPDGKIVGVDDVTSGTGVVRFNPDGSGDQSFGNASWNGMPGLLGRLNVIQTLPNGVTGSGAAGDILLRSNGRINLLGSIGGNCPPQLCRGYVSQQNTVLRNGVYTDFTNDGRADVSVFRPSEGIWYRTDSANNSFTAVRFGLASDKLAPADYDGDGRTDHAVYRDGTWYVNQSSNGQVRYASFGTAEDLPRPGDFDGDGRAEIAVFRPSSGTWFWLRSSDGQFRAVRFGQSGDVPMLGDFDGDAKTDAAVFRPSNGVWYVFRSSDNQTQIDAFGLNGDVPLNGDFNGDGKADLAVFRPSDRTWYIARPTGVPGQNFDTIPFGFSTDTPVPADYDGDGKTDIAVYRNGVWYRINSASNQFFTISFGLNTDIPILAAYQP